jgi:anti-anti-sigma factor
MTGDDTAARPAQAATAQMTSAVRHLPHGVVRVEVNGEVDLCNATALTHALCEAAAGWPARLEVDLSRVTFLGCAGVRALRAARELVATLIVVGAPDPVRRLLTLAGLAVNPPYDQRAEAGSHRVVGEPIERAGEGPHRPAFRCA